jgi:hypothetical protein
MDPMKEEGDANVEDETVEEQSALYNILLSKDTPLHTEFIIKDEELDTVYKIKDELKEEPEYFEMEDEGSSVEYDQQLRVEPKGKRINFICSNINTKFKFRMI